MSKPQIAAAVAATIAVVLLLTYAGGRLFTAGATHQIGSEMSSIAESRKAEKEAEAEQLWTTSEQLQKGMTEAQVIAIMGHPERTVHGEEGKLLHQWSSRNATTYVSVLFQNGPVIEIVRERD